MCRKNQLLAVGAMGFGLGLLAAQLFESEFFCGFVGVAMLALGILLAQKK